MEVALTRIEWSGRQVIQAYITDITERTRARAALAESEARFSAAFRASPAFISILRASDEKYVLANDAYINWLGYSREEILGRTCIDLGLWENLADRDEVLQTIRKSGSIRQREARWRNRQGRSFTVLLSIESIRLNDTPHLLSMAMDITQRKRAEEELVRTLEREKELSQLKSNFVSMVSHEFRTPLGIIQSSAELLRGFYQRMKPDEREEQLESITRNRGQERSQDWLGSRTIPGKYGGLGRRRSVGSTKRCQNNVSSGKEATQRRHVPFVTLFVTLSDSSSWQ